MKKKNNNIIPFRPKKLRGIEKVAIGSCVFVSLVAIAILIYLAISANACGNPITTVPNTDPVAYSTNVPTTEIVADLTTSPTTEPTVGLTTETSEEISTVPTTDVSTETEPEPIPEEVYEVQENLSSWFLENESTDTITLWKKSDDEGNLLVSLRSEEGESLVIFRYDNIEVQDEDLNDWALVEKLTTQELVDIAFVAYHEVGGNNHENVQAQVGVLRNRVQSKRFQQNSLRAVVTAEGQYSCKNAVLSRRLKFKSELERQDLEKCFREVLKVLANEGTLEVPDNVVFAAMFKQGSGVWKVIDGTYYCYE